MAKKVWQVTEVIEKIQDEMDLQEESFVDEAEYIDYINEGIDEAEAEIHQLYEGYFNTTSTINIVSGTAAYNLPANIYANKLKHVQYKKNSTDYYRVPRIRLQEIAHYEEQTSADYAYDIQNDGTANGAQLVLYPTPTESVSGGIRLWYIRNAERVSALTDLVDIPEFIQFIFAYMRVKIARKELSPLLVSYQEGLERQRELMRRTLSEMIPDEEERIDMDLSFYNDFDNQFLVGDEY